MQITVAKALKYNSKEWHNEIVQADEFHQYLTNNIKEFDYLSTDIAKIDKHEKGEIKKQLLCFLGCELKKDGVRRENNIKARTVITFDIEGMNGHTAPAWTEFHETLRSSVLGEQGIAYYWYHTLSHTDDNPRYRLIIPLAKPIKNKDQYEALTKHLAHLIDENIDNYIDTVSFKYNQFIYLPHSFADDRLHNKLIVGYSGGINLLDLEQFNGDILDVDEVQEVLLKPKKQPQQFIKPFTHDRAIQIFKAYIEVDSHNLQDRTDYYVSVITVLANAVHNKEIELNTAVECCRILAMGNEVFEEDNVKHFHYEYNNTKVTSEYTFRSKFYMVARKKLEPKSMKELYNLLYELGEEWRALNTEEDKKGNIKVPLMPVTTIQKMLLDNVHFGLIGDNGDRSPTYIYDIDKGIYITSERLFHRLILKLEYRSTTKQWAQVEKNIRAVIDTNEPFNDRYLIPVNNGIFDLVSKQLLPFEHKYYITSKIVTDYNPEAFKPKYFDFDAWLSSIACGDKEIINVLWQVINEAINPNYTRKKIGIMLGDGNNGKGTFQQLLINLIGFKNIATLRPPEFAEKFKIAMLRGKVCNIGDDISSAYLDEIGNLQSVATGDVTTFEEKGKQSQSAIFRTFCLFSANALPRVRNTTNGWYRRLLIIPFNADFNGEAENTDIKEKYINDKHVLEYVLKIALHLDFAKFSSAKAIDEQLEQYKEINDYILAYIKDEYTEQGYHELERVPFVFIKQQCLRYLNDNGLRQSIKNSFASDFVKKMNNQGVGEYEKKKVRYPLDIQNGLPIEISMLLDVKIPHVSLVKKE